MLTQVSKIIFDRIAYYLSKGMPKSTRLFLEMQQDVKLAPRKFHRTLSPSLRQEKPPALQTSSTVKSLPSIHQIVSRELLIIRNIRIIRLLLISLPNGEYLEQHTPRGPDVYPHQSS